MKWLFELAGIAGGLGYHFECITWTIVGVHNHFMAAPHAKQRAQYSRIMTFVMDISTSAAGFGGLICPGFFGSGIGVMDASFD